MLFISLSANFQPHSKYNSNPLLFVTIADGLYNMLPQFVQSLLLFQVELSDGDRLCEKENGAA